jgi:hypothetical protein
MPCRRFCSLTSFQPASVIEQPVTLAARLNATPVNFRKLLQSFRQRFGELVRQEISRLAHLMRALS